MREVSDNRYHMKTDIQQEKKFPLTFIQVISAIAVVYLHVNGVFWSFSTERWWISANIIECVCYFAVPVFFMITGITLLDFQDRYSTKAYFRKRIEKTVVPYLAWSLIGIVFSLAIGRITLEQVTAGWIVKGLVSTGGIIDLYWFFQPLFFVYLSIPLFAAIDKDKKKKTAEYLLAAGFLFNVVVPFVNTTFHLGLTVNFNVAVVSGYLFYALGGWYIYNYPPGKKAKVVLYVLAIAGLLLHIIGTYVLSVRAGSVQGLFKGYNNLPAMLYCFGIFVFLKDFAGRIREGKGLYRVVTALGKYTFPLYLIHWFILQIIRKLAIFNETSLIYRLLAPYAILLIVVAVTWVIRKIPVIKKIVP